MPKISTKANRPPGCLRTGARHVITAHAASPRAASVSRCSRSCESITRPVRARPGRSPPIWSRSRVRRAAKRAPRRQKSDHHLRLAHRGLRQVRRFRCQDVSAALKINHALRPGRHGEVRPTGCPNRTVFSPHFPDSAVRRDGGDRNEKESRDCGVGAIVDFFAGDRAGTRGRCRARRAVGRRGAWADRSRGRRGCGLHGRAIDFPFVGTTIERPPPRASIRWAGGALICRRQSACVEKPGRSADGRTSAGGYFKSCFQCSAGSGS